MEAIVGHSNPAMTRHYTHVGDAAAGRAIASLPSVAEGVVVLQEETTADSDKLKRIRILLKGMDAKNWQKTRRELLKELS